MQITFLADKLSEMAYLALENSSNRNKFLREAVEYYISNNKIKNNKNVGNDDIKAELLEIKNLIIQLGNNELSKTNKQIKSIEGKTSKETIDNSGLTKEEKEQIEREVDNFNNKFR